MRRRRSAPSCRGLLLAAFLAAAPLGRLFLGGRFLRYRSLLHGGLFRSAFLGCDLLWGLLRGLLGSHLLARLFSGGLLHRWLLFRCRHLGGRFFTRFLLRRDFGLGRRGLRGDLLGDRCLDGLGLRAGRRGGFGRFLRAARRLHHLLVQIFE